MNRRRFPRLKFLALCSVVFSIPLLFWRANPATAQPIPLEVQREAQRIQEREIERREARERRLLESQSPIKDHTPVAIEEDLAGDQGACQPVTEIRFAGMGLLKPDRFAVQSSKAIGDCVGQSSLKALERSITNAYVKRGFITSRAFATRDPSQPDVVLVRVVEGRIAKVGSEGTGGNRAYSASEIGLAFGSLEQKPLNLRRLEQGIDQLARLPSASPRIDILPAAEAGASEIVVKRERTSSWLRPSASINNGGSKSTGEATFSLSLDADNSFGLADYYSVYFVQDIASGLRKNSTAAGLFLSMPVGELTLSLSANHQFYRSILTSNELMFSNDGQTSSGFVAIDALAFRNASHKLAVSVQLAVFDTVTRIQSIRLSTNSYRLATITARTRLQSRFDASVVSFDLAFVKGLAILGAEAADFGPTGPTIGAAKIEAGLALQMPVKIGRTSLRYSTTIRGQYARSPLLAAERLSIGGEHSVRGYRDDGLSGDHGIVARTQIAFPLFTTFKEIKSNSATRFGGFVGHDAGWVWNIGSGDGVTQLHSALAGIELANRRLAGRVVLAKALSRLPGFDRSRPEILASLTLSI